MRILTWIATLGLAACFCSELVAQDVAITNVRIITVTGAVIRNDAVVRPTAKDEDRRKLPIAR